MKPHRPLPLLFLSFFLPAALAQAAEPPLLASGAAAAPRPEPVSYYGVYLKGHKIGSVVMRHGDLPATKDRPAAQREEVVTALDLRILGAGASLNNTTVSLSDSRTGRPLSEESRTEGAGRVSTVTATFTDRAVNYVATVDGQQKTGALSLNPGDTFLLDVSSTPGFHPRVGLQMQGKVFVAETLRLSDEKITVAAKEPVVIGGQTVTAYRVVEANSTSGASTSYLNEAGDLLQSSGPLGMEFRKEPKNVALAAPDANAPDLSDVLAITPTGEPLTAPRTARHARYSLSGVTRPLPATDAVQSVTYAAGTPAGGPPQTATVVVDAHPLPASGGRLYAQPGDAPAALRPYLTATLYVPSDSQTFRDLARQVVGGETDAAKAAAKIAAWAHATVKPDPGIAAIRTAADVYRDPRGVCRDYTVLFTAVARAAGLPTKQCVGIVCAEGRFFYHAWPEVWVGSAPGAAPAAGWVALEPTFGAPYADATHIKLAEGESTDLANVTADIGKYQIKVEEVR